MASLLAHLASAAIVLRGSKREFRSAERTLAEVDRRHGADFTPPASVARRTRVVRREVGGWPVFELSDPPVDAATSRRAIYLHGGVYSFEIDPFHWRLIADLALASGSTFIVPIMPLAPHGTASVVVPAVADLVAAQVELAGASRVSVLGDSSGGGMALATAQVLRDRGVDPLGAIVLISPWLDISGTDPRLAELDPSDPWLAIPGTRAAGAQYRAELAESDPLVSPIHGSLDGLGPITMFSGTRDILNADASRLVQKAAHVGHPLTYHEGLDMIHNWPLLPIPEGRDARRQIVDAITR